MTKDGTSLSGVDYLLNLNARHSAEFSSEAVRGARRLRRFHHPTEFTWLKCMDGRINGSLLTKTTPGIIDPVRNLGGAFDCGWPMMRAFITNKYEYCLSKGRPSFWCSTYHFSRGDVSRGCAGFNDDTEAAKASASGFKHQLISILGQGEAAYTILLGIETDLDALILHGDDEENVVDLSTVTDSSPENVRAILRALYPGMSSRMVEDFLLLVAGNIEHIKEVRAANRPIANITHGEWAFCFGRGFDWLHEPNTAVIVGPFNPDLRTPIITAARNILLRNLDEGRIPRERGVVLLSSAPFRDRAGYDHAAALVDARWKDQYAMKVITEEVPQLLPYLHRLVVVTDMDTRAVEVLERT